MADLDPDERLIRTAIAARGDMARIGALVHAVVGLVCIAVLVQGGEPVPWGLGTVAFLVAAGWLEITARRRREGRSPVLHALIYRPGEVQHLQVSDEESGLQIRVTAAGATDYVCPPGALEDLVAALRRRSPQATFVDLRR
ncbi:MAG: hypothetical protein JNL83_40090 [Myxococcales bacterium]|nr:hypothetical protein [Myxococcales bacterium]